MHEWIPDKHEWISDKNEVVAELKYNKQAHSFRLNTNEKRLFFLEKAGFLQSKLLLKTEYSVAVGEIYFVKNGAAGIIRLNNEKYAFYINAGRISFYRRKNRVAEVRIGNFSNPDLFEFSALLFSLIKVQQEKQSYDRAENSLSF